MIKRMFLFLLLLGTALTVGLLAPPANAQSSPQRPFPQHVTYVSGTIRPTNFTQAQLDDHVRTFYNYWKGAYLTTAGTNSSGQALYRVRFGKSGTNADATVSEGQGYGMVITALMAGHDPAAQTIFDGLWRFARAYPSGIDNRLMSWKIVNGVIVEGNASAFDGDADIAYGLLLAHAQWGSSGAINYQAAAMQVLDGVLAATIGPQSRLPTLGDWVSANGSPHSQYTPRSSDFMLGHFRTFARATNNPVWNTVATNVQAVIDRTQSAHSPITGLLPDFMVNCNPITSCTPSPASFLEGPYDGHYYYNAGRNPWRIGIDVLHNGSPAAQAALQKTVRWLAGATGGNAQNIKAGYLLNGTAIGSYFTTFFVAPFGVAAMTDPTQQAFLNNIYASVYNTQEDYYEDSVNLVALLIMTGNYWDPAPAVAPPPTATPVASATPVVTATPTFVATATPTFVATPTVTPPSSAKRIIGYYTAWSVYGRQYFVNQIPAAKLTHLNYAFANVTSDGRCVLGDVWADTQYPYPGDIGGEPFIGNFKQLNRLKQQHPHLKTLLSVGGWTWSANFSNAALTVTSRQQFAQSCVQMMKQYGFDGLDIDWEYPVSGGLTPGRPEDKQNYTLLLAELRAQLTTQGVQDGRSYLLTIAAPAGPSNIANLELPQLLQYLDWINLMTYDFHGGWDSSTGFNAPLYQAPGDTVTGFNTHATVQNYLSKGIAADKLVMGVPFYGRGWQGVPNVNNGLFQPATGVPQGTWEAGNFDYYDLKARFLPSYPRYWNSTALVPWLYNPTTGIMITYDDPESLGHKADYINANNLGGAMFWELSGDDSQSSLLTTLHSRLNGSPVPPTATPLPTHTPTAGPSPTPSSTSSPTATPTSTVVAPPTATPSSTATPTLTPTHLPGACLASYRLASDWGSGFTANLFITNQTGAALTNWTVTWTFPGNQQLTGLWNGVLTQTGNHVHVTNAAWNGAVANGATLTFGFQGGYSGANSAPTAFTLNGIPCTTAGATSTPAPTNTVVATPTQTPTLTPTPIIGGVAIFADGFETGNLNNWSASVIDGGDLSATAGAALAGSFGMNALLDDNVAIHVTDDSPNGETSYQASFRFDPNTLGMTNGDLHTIFYGYTSPFTQMLRVELRFAAGQYQLRAALRDDAGVWHASAFFIITDDPHWLQLDWRAAPMAGANSGTLAFRIDGALKANLTGVDNDTRRIDRVRLGAVLGIDAGTGGSYFFDDFASYRLPAATAAAQIGDEQPEDRTVVTEAVTAEELAAEAAEAMNKQLFLPLVMQ